MARAMAKTRTGTGGSEGKASPMNVAKYINGMAAAYKKVEFRPQKSGGGGAGFDLEDGNYEVALTADTRLTTDKNGGPTVAWCLSILDGDRTGETFTVWDNLHSDQEAQLQIRMSVFANRIATLCHGFLDESELQDILFGKEGLTFNGTEWVASQLQELLSDMVDMQIKVRVKHNTNGYMVVYFNEVIEHPEGWSLDEEEAAEPEDPQPAPPTSVRKKRSK